MDVTVHCLFAVNHIYTEGNLYDLLGHFERLSLST